MLKRSDLVGSGNQLFKVRDLPACLLSTTYTDICCNYIFLRFLRKAELVMFIYNCFIYLT
jgi:hypothetical protein